jgi:2-methylcitrate dehydratase
MLGGPASEYVVALPEPGEPRRGILETYTKAHSAEYQAQALIDLAIELAPRVGDFAAIEEIVVETSHHTHTVIGTGSNDPQKFDPDATRETLDHSIMYILAVALEDRRWHHEASYASERAHRPSTLELWRKIRTVEDPVWTARYHEPDPAKRAFGGCVSIRMKDGSIVAGEKAAADAHPNGARPWRWPDYLGKFDALTVAKLPDETRALFLGAAKGVAELEPVDIATLVPTVLQGTVVPDVSTGEGIFDHTKARAADAGE